MVNLQPFTTSQEPEPSPQVTQPSKARSKESAVFMAIDRDAYYKQQPQRSSVPVGYYSCQYKRVDKDVKGFKYQTVEPAAVKPLNTNVCNRIDRTLVKFREHHVDMF